MTLDGKVALVTGAGGMRTIGRAIAVRLARDGADVAISDIERAAATRAADERDAGWLGLESVAKDVEAHGARCLPLSCDLTQPRQVKKMIGSVIKMMGRIDILVNCARAPVGKDRAPILEMPESEWDRVFGVNVRGAMTCSKYAAREMIKAGRGGRIINISSFRARVPGREISAYASSKAALNMLTFCLALELAPHNILVTAVCPGSVDTNRVGSLEEEEAAREGITHAEWHQRMLAERAKQVPLGRVAVPEDVAGAVAFLASEDSSFITGQSLGVSGGYVVY